MPTNPSPYYTFKSQHSNRIYISFGGNQQPVGLIESLRVSESYGTQPLYQVGSIEPAEIVPSAAQYTLACSLILLKTSTLVSQGLAPDNAIQELYFKPFTIFVQDTDNLAVIRQWEMCYYSQGDITFQMNRVVMSDATFMAQRTSSPTGEVTLASS